MSVKRLKILVFSDWFLPGFRAGGPIRSLANLVNLLDCDFYIVTRITDHHSTTPYTGKTSGKWDVYNDHTKVMYLNEGDINSTQLMPLLKDETFDRIYINSLFSPKFALLPLWLAQKAGRASKVIVSPRGMLKSGALSVKPWKKKIFLTAARWIGLYNGVMWEATNEQEANEIKHHFGEKVRYHIAPNLAMVPAKRVAKPSKRPGDLDLICVARVSPEKGILEALQFLRDAKLNGEVSIDFYGALQNKSYLEACKQMAAQIPEAIVKFHGEVNPVQLPSLVAGAHFMYMPTLGENYGHAIVEALVHATPVIISNRTPWHGLEVQHAGWDLPLESASFVPVLQYCLAMNDEEYTLWCEGAYGLGKQSALNPDLLDRAYALFRA